MKNIVANTEAGVRRLARRHGLILKKVPYHRHSLPKDQFLLVDVDTNGVMLGAGPLEGVELDEVVAYFNG